MLSPHTRLSEYELHSEFDPTLLNWVFYRLRSQLRRRFDAVAEQFRPDTLNSTGDGRRGGPGGEVEVWFGLSVSIVGVDSLWHTLVRRARNRIVL